MILGSAGDFPDLDPYHNRLHFSHTSISIGSSSPYSTKQMSINLEERITKNLIYLNNSAYLNIILCYLKSELSVFAHVIYTLNDTL